VTGFRVSRARFDRMVLEFGVSCGASEPLSADEELQFGEKLAITLYRLATGNFVRTIADHFEVSEASVTRYTRAVCQWICNRYAPLAQLAPVGSAEEQCSWNAFSRRAARCRGIEHGFPRST